ncbi:MAG: hypothetical protein H7066_09205, partial [Cytophagaceae bacterium]|nr:hypothetical protein [Gemmatimonadaceae bacterium]
MTSPRRPTLPRQVAIPSDPHAGREPQSAPPKVASVKDGDLGTPMELTEFMSQVGVVMRLPTRNTKAIPVVPASGRG